MFMKSKMIYAAFIASMVVPPLAGFAIVSVDAAQANVSLANTSNGNANNAPACEIETTHQNGSVLVQAVFNADQSGEGSYQFGVTGLGVNISQGGQFDAATNGTNALSKIMLSSGKTYHANLHIMQGNKIFECQNTFR